MKLGRLILIEIVIIAILAAIGGGIYYFYNQGRDYVTTSDAQLGGKLITAVATAPGKIQGSLPTIGASVTSGQTLMREQVAAPASTSQGSATPSTVDIAAPAAGRVAQLQVVDGQFVQAGEPVATLVRFDGNTVTAYVPETLVHKIRVGQFADVYVDAYPNDSFPGHVAAIVPATQSSLSLLPSTQSSGNFTKVTQRIPVIISFQNPNNAHLYMGLSVEIRVHTGNS